MPIYNIYNMDKPQKKKSTDTITMAPKKSNKTDLEKAIEYYKVKGKNPATIASQLGITVTTSIKKLNGQKVKKTVTPSNDFDTYYGRRIQETILQRWKTDTQKYVGRFKMFFRQYDKKSLKWRDAVRGFNVTATKKDFDDILAMEVANLQSDLTEQYSADELDVDSFNYAEDGERIPVKVGDGVSLKTGVVYTTVKGGQRKVGKSITKGGLKMRFTTLKLSDDKQEWDTGKGRCVFDYLIYTYKDKAKRKLDRPEIVNYKGIECSKAEVYLNELLKEEGDCNEPLTEGVSIFQLENFCDEFGIAMYAFDAGDNLIEYYKPNTGRDRIGKKALIFTCYGEHFYPVEDKSDRSNKSARGALTDNSQRFGTNEETVITGDPKEKKVKTVIAPTEYEWEQNKELMSKQKQAIRDLNSFVEKYKVPNGATEFWFADKLLYNCWMKLKKDATDLVSQNFQNEFAFRYLLNAEMKVPYPLNSQSLDVIDNTIQRVVYDDTIVLTKPIDFKMKRYMEDNDETYQGETFVFAMNEIWRQLYPFELSKAPFLSNANDAVQVALNAENVKNRTHIGRTSEKYSSDEIKQMLLNGDAICVDIKRCYADCIYNQRDPFLRFTGREQIELYDKKPLTAGLYFVKTKDNTLLHQNNWYSRKIIEKAKNENIDFRITHQIRCIDAEWQGCYLKPDADLADLDYDDKNNLIPNKLTHRYMNMTDLFKDYCDAVIEQTEQDEDFSLTKLVINSLTGYLGKTTYKQREVSLTNNLEEVWSEFVVPEVQDNPNADVFINPIENNGDKLYLYGCNYTKTNLANGLPMYIQMLDWSNMALYDLGKNIGGEIVYRKTDMVISVGGKLDSKYIAETPCSYSDTFGTYYQDTDMEKFQGASFHFLEPNDKDVITPVIDSNWNDYPEYTTSSEWEGILKLAVEKGGLLIIGRAGTGKSYIIDQGVKAKILPEDTVTRLSFTNRAARNINGTTINKAMALNMENKTNNKTIEGLKKHKFFIVDEIGMINNNLWNKLMYLKKVTGAIFILLGDYRQCPPIEDGEEVDYFNHSYVKYLTNNNRIELNVPQRYDLELWDWLEDYYEEGIVGSEVVKKKLTIDDIVYRKNICYYNKTRERINKECQDYFKKDKAFVVLSYDGDVKDKQKTALIYTGLPLMAIVNNKELEIINTEEFWVEAFSSAEETITMYRDEDHSDKLTIGFKDFHKCFVVNYASTTHKSQGATISLGINIFDWYALCRDRRLGYTAVSRAKKCEQVWIDGVVQDYDY